jgi:NADH-quinone oxidoreductase subunit L
MFHLVTHAFFKALLFLSAGSIIQGVERGHHHVEHDPKLKKHHDDHGHFDPQDMRNMGGLRSRMKITFWVYLIGSIALAGLPPLAGFWSKDEILAEEFLLNKPAFWMLTIAAALTAFYISRQVFMVFFNKPRSAAAEHASESPPVMTVPLIILAVLSAFGGLLNLPNLHTFTDWVEHTLHHVHEGEFVVWIALLSTGLALLAILIGWFFYGSRYDSKFMSVPPAKRGDDPLRSILGPVFNVLNHKYWVDELYWVVILNPYISLSKFLADQVDWRFWHDWFHDQVIFNAFNRFSWFLSLKFDLGIIDGIANGIGDVTKRSAARLRQVQTGFVRNYALSIFLGVVIIIGYLILR